MINNPSPQDIQTLREVVRRVLRDPSTQIMHDVGINNQASDCFVALVPAGGIPPLDVLSGTSTADGDIPGSAICNLYRINHDFGATTGTSDDDYAELLAISGGQKRIYNLHSSPVTANGKFRRESTIETANPKSSFLSGRRFTYDYESDW